MYFMGACAFTGHRPEGFDFGFDESDVMCRGIICALRVQIKRMYNMGVRTFYTGCATGVDTWAAEIVLDEKRTRGDIRLIAAVPFRGQENGWDISEKKRYREILDGCDEVVVVSERFSRGAFHKRDRYMVDNADAVIAVYDRERPFSGTGYTVRYAIENNRTVVIIDPKNLEDTTINIERMENI